jgi:hypothetical protein
MDAAGSELRAVSDEREGDDDEECMHVFLCSYSSADSAFVRCEALLRTIRRIRSATHFERVSKDHAIVPHMMSVSPIKLPAQEDCSNEGVTLWLACSPGDSDA